MSVSQEAFQPQFRTIGYQVQLEDEHHDAMPVEQQSVRGDMSTHSQIVQHNHAAQFEVLLTKCSSGRIAQTLYEEASLNPLLNRNAKLAYAARKNNKAENSAVVCAAVPVQHRVNRNLLMRSHPLRTNQRHR